MPLPQWGEKGAAAPAPVGLEGLESKKLIAMPLPQWGEKGGRCPCPSGARKGHESEELS